MRPVALLKYQIVKDLDQLDHMKSTEQDLSVATNYLRYLKGELRQLQEEVQAAQSDFASEEASEDTCPIEALQVQLRRDMNRLQELIDRSAGGEFSVR